MMSRISKIITIKVITTLVIACSLFACGGGSNTTTGSGGAPAISNKCSISNLIPSSGTMANLSKSQDQLSASFVLTMLENSAIETSANFENATADDWIEGVPRNESLSAGTHTMVIAFDLNSPSKSTADLYTKLSLTVSLPGNEACIENQTVNITLSP